MTLFDLVFIVTFLGTLGILLRALVQLLRGRPESATRSVRRLSLYLGPYGIVLIVVSLASPGVEVPVGAEQRFDDWAISVKGAERVDRIGDVVPEGSFWIVSAQVSSHARGRRQRETDVHAFLVDDRGHRYEVSPRGQAALERAGLAGLPLTSFLDAGTSFQSKLAFDLPRNAKGVAFVKQNRSWFPSLFIIGDPSSLLHRPTRVPLNLP